MVFFHGSSSLISHGALRLTCDTNHKPFGTSPNAVSGLGMLFALNGALFMLETLFIISACLAVFAKAALTGAVTSL